MGFRSGKCSYVQWGETEKELISPSMEGSLKIRLKLMNEKIVGHRGASVS